MVGKRPKSRKEVLKGGLNVSFALKPRKNGFMVSGVWISEKLWRHSIKKYGVDSYWIWKTLSNWFKKRQHLLDKAAEIRKKLKKR